MIDAELKDYFAAAALPGLVSDPDLGWSRVCKVIGEDDSVPFSAEKWESFFYRYVAVSAYGLAEAMIAEINKLNNVETKEK